MKYKLTGIKNWLYRYPMQLSLVTTLLVVFLFEWIGTFKIGSITNNSSEFNVIAMAADLAGYDWKDTILKTHYYGYTSSLIFSIIFHIKFIASNPKLLLSSLLFINVVINTLNACILYFITLNIIKCNKWHFRYSHVALITTACSLFISNQVLTKSVTNENILLLCYYITIYVIAFGNRKNSKKNRINNSVILALMNVIAYATNGRGAILIAITVIMYIIFKLLHLNPFGNIIVYVLSFTVFFLIASFEKGYFVDTYFAVTQNVVGELKNNNVSGIMDRALQLLNIRGIKLYLKLVVGWGTYFITSTYGWGVVAIISAIQNIYDKVKGKNNISDSELALSLITVLFLMGISILGICFYHDSFYAMSYDPTSPLANGRVDKLIYGRYISTIKSIIIMLGLVETIYRKRNNKQIQCISVGIIIIFDILFYLKIVPLMLGRQYAMVDIPEFALFLGGFQQNYKFGIIENRHSFILIFAFILVIYVLTIFFSKYKKKIYSVYLVFALNIIIGIMYTDILINPRSEFYKNSINQAYVEYITQRLDGNNLIVADNNTYLYQFFLPTKKVIDSQNLDMEDYYEFDKVIFIDIAESDLIKFHEYNNSFKSIILSETKFENERLVLNIYHDGIYEYSFAGY